jgi:hypothetical protein
MMDLGTQFRTFSADDLVTQIVPTRDYKGPMDAAYQEILWDEAGPILDVYRGVEPGKPVKPRDVIVSVVGTSDLNPTGMAKEMAALGFDASGSVDEDSGRDQTVVRYGEDGGEAAILAARYMDADVDFRFDEEIRGRQVRIVLGSDFKGIRQEPADLSSLSAEELNQLMEATDMVLNAEGEPVTTTTTTTTPVTAPPTTEDPGLVEGETSSSLPAATGESGLEGGPVATGPFATVTTDGGSTPPTTQLEQSSTIEGGFVPIDYQRSLSC